MSHNHAPLAALTVVAEFPKQYFLENIVVRADGSFLIHVANKKELWYVPSPGGGTQVKPVHLHTYAENAAGIVELEPDVFALLTGNVYTTHECYLHRLDMRNWQPGSAATPELICQFPEQARGVNGACLLAPGVMLVADCFAGLIWRLDFKEGETKPAFQVWLAHESMGYFPGKMKPEQPGVNGVHFAKKTHHVYYTSTAKKLFMRVAVDPTTLMPAGEPELVVAGRMGDDFLIDEDAEVIYLTTHRQNTIDVVSMDPGLNSGSTQSVAGDPPNPVLIGPSAGAWGRQPNDPGHVAYFITDGGTASPPPEGPTSARLFRVDLQPIGKEFPGAI